LPVIKEENGKIAVELFIYGIWYKYHAVLKICGRIILREYIGLKGEEFLWLLGN